jgi:histidinol-phosphate aminotransferase
MSRFWVDKVKALQPYVPGEQPQTPSLIKLNTNEHALPPPDSVMQAIAAVGADQLRRYPDPAATTLCAAIARAEGLHPDQVFVGNGSDEVLAHLWAAFLADRAVQTLDTTYGFYPVWATLYGSDLHEVPVNPDFSVDLSALKASPLPVVLANPNAPTGLAISREEVESLVIDNRDRLVVIDEAYFGFGAESSAPLVHDYDNLLVTRSLSKSHALAGMRIGYALAHPDLIEGLRRVKDSFNSYPLDCIAQVAATAAIEDQEWFREAAGRVVANRQAMISALSALGFEVLPSAANFIFVKHPDVQGEQIFVALREADILVRRWDKPRIGDWLRISVGDETQTQQLLRVTEEIISGLSQNR